MASGWWLGWLVAGGPSRITTLLVVWFWFLYHHNAKPMTPMIITMVAGLIVVLFSY